jgi:tetratricopeptide (TPR) repeat protein
VIGEIVGGRWQVVARAGAGGMGVVYRTVDRETGQAAALKVMAAELSATERFWQEAELLAGLSHPAIVRYLGRGRTDAGQPYLAMEWLEGEDLERRLGRGPLSIGDTLAIARRVIGALEAAHARGVVHRDLKPSNLFLVEADPTRVKLLDFGIARAALRTRQMTRTGAVLGTVGYMAPEQATGARDVDARADLFSLGCVLYECLAGAPAFAGGHLVAVLGKVLHEDPPALGLLRDDVPPMLADVVARLLAKSRDARPPAARAVRDALDEIHAGEAGAPAVIASPPRVRRNEQRLMSALLVDASHGVVENATLTPEQLADDWDRARRIASKYGGEAVILANQHVLVTMGATGSASDQAQRAAACALELSAAHPGAAVAVATGRAETTERTLVGPVIDRAAELLQDASGAILLDELTARFAEARFEVRTEGPRLRLVGTRADADEEDTRRLLGKPTPCVGRRKELALLEATLEECIEEHVARAVVVTAPAGAGKSRLRRELVRRIREQGREVRVLGARGELIAAASSMALARQLLRAAIDALEGTPEVRVRERLDARIDAVLPEDEQALAREFLSELLGLARDPAPSDALRAASDDPRLMAARLEQTFASWLAAEAGRTPLLLVLDDLHLSDAASLRYIDAALECAPFMLLGLGRPEDAERFADLGMRVGRQDIRLTPLSDRAASELVRAALGSDADDATLRRIVERAAGNAFYLEELIRRVAESRSDELPETIIAMAQSRIERLEPEARRALRAASVFGETFHDGGVASLLGEGARPETTREWLSALVDQELLSERRDSRFTGQRELAFRHALLREAAYAMLTDADRAAGHRIAGAWLESLGERDPVILASHFERGGDGNRAVRYLVTAARAAAAVYAHDHAAAHLDRGLRIVAKRPTSVERDREELALLLEQAPSLRAVRGYADPGLLALLERTRRLADRLHDAPALFRALRSLLSFRFVAGDMSGTLEIAARLRELAAQLPEHDAESHHTLAGALMHVGDLETAIRHFEAARNGYDPETARRHLSMFGSDLGVFNGAWEAHALWLYGLEDRALACANEALRTARALGHAYSEALAQAYASVLHYMRGDRRSCAEAADAARELCEKHGFAYYGHWGTLMGAWAREDGDPIAAATAMRNALAALDQEGSRARRAIYLAALAEVLRAGDRRQEALDALDQAEEWVTSSGDRLWSAELGRLRAVLQPESGVAHARRALELARRLRARPLVVRSAVTLALAMQRGSHGARASDVVREALAGLPDGGSSLDRDRALRLLSTLS